MFPANNAVKAKKKVEYLDKAAPLNLPKWGDLQQARVLQQPNIFFKPI